MWENQPRCSSYIGLVRFVIHPPWLILLGLLDPCCCQQAQERPSVQLTLYTKNRTVRAVGLRYQNGTMADLWRETQSPSFYNLVNVCTMGEVCAKSLDTLLSILEIVSVTQHSNSSFLLSFFLCFCLCFFVSFFLSLSLSRSFLRSWSPGFKASKTHKKYHLKINVSVSRTEPRYHGI